MFTGDTGPNDALWRVVNRIGNLKYPDHRDGVLQQGAPARRDLAPPVPQTLAEELDKLERNAEIYITHMKPGEIEPTMLEIEECAGSFRPRMLQNNLVLEF